MRGDQRGVSWARLSAARDPIFAKKWEKVTRCMK
jgi:hypothetical protein